jgi:N-methylhydantoinase A/oxoprolinase/acetone carboxylase beta subunit
MKMAVAGQLNDMWDNLEKEAISTMKLEGFKQEQITLMPIAFLRYAGQLDDVEVVSPTRRINRPEELDSLIAKFEDLYAKIYSLGARFPQAGFQILEVAVVTSVPKVKPKIKRKSKGPKEPDAHALKGRRKVYFKGKWQEAQLYEMDKLQPGNEIKGPAIVEAPATTLFVPPGRRINLDKWGIIWMDTD